MTKKLRMLASMVEQLALLHAVIRVRGLAVGEIDIDSHALGAFQPADREFLEKCADMIGRYIEQAH